MVAHPLPSPSSQVNVTVAEFFVQSTALLIVVVGGDESNGIVAKLLVLAN